MATLTNELLHLKKSRAAIRGVVTKYIGKLNELLTAEEKLDVEKQLKVKALFGTTEERFNELSQLDDQISTIFRTDNEVNEALLMKEMEGVDEYRERFLECSNRMSALCVNKEDKSTLESKSNASRKLVFPPIQMKKFSGVLLEWLPFWSTFKRMHDDPSLSNEEKFTYLLEVLVPGSKACRVVEMYPPTAENYDKAIASLKQRFGRDDLLIEVYIKEILKLVINRKGDATTLFYNLETQLNALESLGVTSDKYAAILFPLVESCLSDELLKEWQRQRGRHRGMHMQSVSGLISEDNMEESLRKLVSFLRSEVEVEERISNRVWLQGDTQNQTA